MPHKFKAGDPVTMVNDYGVQFPGKTILSAERTNYGLAYKITPTDSPWFAVPERNLFEESSASALAAAARQGGDAQQAPAESPQSGPPQEGNAQ